MNKTEKIAALDTAMTSSTRDNKETFYHFTDNAPKELVDLFLEHYSIEDIEYETFARACEIVSEIYGNKPDTSDTEAEETIYDNASDSASVYTAERLSYLNNNNEYDISAVMREYGEQSIATACAIWYDKQVEQAAIIIKDWVNA